MSRVSHKMKYANLACGGVFIDDHAWVNFDFASTNPCVIGTDLLRRLPLGDATCDVVYSSHFLEHIPRAKVGNFLSECYRVLKPGGTLRLVLPDFEAMCKEYLRQRVSGRHRHADLMVVGIVDQCVRTVPGGELLAVYQSEIDSSGEDKPSELSQYIYQRHGEDLAHPFSMPGSDLTNLISPVTPSREKAGPFRCLFGRLQGKLSHIKYRVKAAMLRLPLQMLPNAFREQNVSLACVGEKHHWLWDFYQLEGMLVNAGFIDVIRVGHDVSTIKEFPMADLDIDSAGNPRKGKDSMYVEARK